MQMGMSLLPGTYVKEYNLGIIPARIVALFFFYEVLVGELRNHLGFLTWITVGTLFLVAARSLAGI